MSETTSQILDSKELNNIGIYFNELPKRQIPGSIVICDSFFLEEMRDLQSPPALYRFFMPKASLAMMRLELASAKPLITRMPSWMNEKWAERSCVLTTSPIKLSLNGTPVELSAYQSQYSVNGASFIKIKLHSFVYLFQPRYTQATPSLALIKELAPNVLLTSTVRSSGTNTIDALINKIPSFLKLCTKKYATVKGYYPFRVFWHPFYEVWPLIALARVLQVITKKPVKFFSYCPVYTGTLRALEKFDLAILQPDVSDKYILLEIDRKTASPKTIESFRNIQVMVNVSINQHFDKGTIVFPVYDQTGVPRDATITENNNLILFPLPSTNYLEDIYVLKHYLPSVELIQYPPDVKTQKSLNACSRNFPTQHWKIDVDYEALLQELKESRMETAIAKPPRLSITQGDESSDVEELEDYPAIKAKVPEFNRNVPLDIQDYTPMQTLEPFACELPSTSYNEALACHQQLIKLNVILEGNENVNESANKTIHPHKIK